MGPVSRYVGVTRKVAWYDQTGPFVSAELGVIQAIVSRIPGAAFAVDARLQVVAWNRRAEEGLHLPASEAVGRACYEVVPAVDVETGRPCYECCPLVDASPQYGWAYNRVLRAPWAAGRRRTRLNCFLLKCLFPSSQQGTLCFVGPPTAAAIEAHSRVLEAIESIYPVVSGPADVKKALSVFVASVLRATGSDAGELHLVDHETGEMMLMEHQGLSAEAMREYLGSEVGGDLATLIAGSEVPLLAVVAPQGEGDPTAAGWYLCAPLVVEGRVLGALGVVSRRPDFDVAAAGRILFPVAVQLGVYLRWAYLVGEEPREGVSTRGQDGAARLRFYCMGRFRVFVDGEAVPMGTFRRLKALALLKFMVASRGRPVSREALMELLWPEADPAHAGGNLRVVLHDLRRALEPRRDRGSPSSFVAREGDLVYLDPSPRVWVDAEEFVRSAREAARFAGQGRDEEALTACQTAASLYGGEYMEDEPYSDWCLFERERLRENYLNVLKLMVSILERRHDMGGAVETCRTALTVDRGREDFHRELMRLLWRAGRRAEALRQYDTCRRILWDEIESEPSEETDLLYRAVLAGASEGRRAASV